MSAWMTLSVTGNLVINDIRILASELKFPEGPAVLADETLRP
jgi:hypothetical protein